MENEIKKVIQSNIELPFKITVINDNPPSDVKGKTKSVDKETFCKIVQLLEEVDEASAQMFDAGIDLSPHESRFFDIIETLLHQVFSENQIALIHMYLFGDTYLTNVPTPVDKNGNSFEPETPEELWIAVTNLK